MRSLLGENYSIYSVDNNCFSKRDLDYKETTSLKDINIKYKRTVGLHKKFEIRYESEGTLYNIKTIFVRHKEFIKYDIENNISENKINIRIDIPKNLPREFSFKENLLIYTDFDLREFSFYVECEDSRTVRPVISILEELYLGKSEEVLVKRIENLKNVDDILEVTDRGRKILDFDLSIRSYMRIVKRCIEVDSKNIKTALFCEKLIKERAILIKAFIDPIKEMYKKGIVTKNTSEVIDFLRVSRSRDKELNRILIKPKIKLRIIDKEFKDEFIEAYNNTSHKSYFDKLINTILDCDNVKYDDNLIKIIFDFYKRNNDVKSLVKVLRELRKKDIDFLKYGITIKDRNLLVKAYKKNILIDFKELIDYSEEYYKKSLYIRKAFIDLFEDELLSGKEKTRDYLYSNHQDVIKYLSNYSKIIYSAYIFKILNSVGYDNQNKIVVLENYLNNVKGTLELPKQGQILERIINYYIKVSNENKYMEYIKYYFKNIAFGDSGNIFKNIIKKNGRDEAFLYAFLIRNGLSLVELFKDRDYEYEILMSINKGILRNRSYELLKITIEKYGEMQEKSLLAKEKRNDLITKSSESINAIKALVINSANISYDNYNKGIISVFNGLSNKEQKDMYKILIKRKDLPMDFREKNYGLLENSYNKEFIINEFLNNGWQSYLSKELALKAFFEDDNKFLEIVSIGRNNDKIKKIILNKLSKKFLNSKEYVKQVILAVKEKDRELKFILECVNEYFKYRDDIEKRCIFERFKICDREYGEICDKVRIKEIFTKEERSGYLFKNEGVRTVLKKYMDENKIKYDEISSKILIVEEAMEDNKDRKTTLDDVLNLVKIQQGLILNGGMTLIFGKDDIKYINDTIFIKNVEKLVKYEDKILLYKDEYKYNENIKQFLLEDDKIFVTEKLIVTIIRSFLNDIEVLDNSIKEKLIEKVYKNNSIETYGQLKDTINAIISKRDILEGEFKEYKYSKYLEDFYLLSDDFKDKVVCLIIKKRDTRKCPKDIIINYTFNKRGDKSNFNKYMTYLLECFNEHYFDLDTFELREVYEKIINIIKDNKEEDCLKEFIRDNQNNFIQFFLNANKRCNYSNLEVFLEATSLDIIDDKKYLKSKLA